MKKLIITTIIALLTVAGITARAEEWPNEYLGLPGDNLNLFAVMKLFQESETLESFERNLNDENSRINNLDLNGDNLVDYIMVFDYVDGNVHNIVLRVALNRNDNQDVAVFTVHQLKKGDVEIQLIGDEALYGKNYIVEPAYAETPNPGYNGRVKIKNNVVVINRVVYTYDHWPLIRYIYLPGYSTWRSDWYWGYQPHYWNPWQPYYWHYYYGYHYNFHNHYYSHYRHWNEFRYTRYNDFYYSGIRIYSPTIIVKIKEGNYKNTYSRPDLRSDGSALYASTNRTSEKVTTNTNVRRTESSTVQTRSAETVNTANTRRTTATTSSAVVKETANPARRTTVTAKPAPTAERVTTSRATTATKTTTNTGVKTNVTSRRTTPTVNNKVSTTARQNTVPTVQKPATTATRREAPVTSSRTTVSKPSVSQSRAPVTSSRTTVSRPSVSQSRAPVTSSRTTVSRPSVSQSRAPATNSRPTVRSTGTVKNGNTAPSAGRTTRR